VAVFGNAHDARRRLVSAPLPLPTPSPLPSPSPACRSDSGPSCDKVVDHSASILGATARLRAWARAHGSSAWKVVDHSASILGATARLRAWARARMDRRRGRIPGWTDRGVFRGGRRTHRGATLTTTDAGTVTTRSTPRSCAAGGRCGAGDDAWRSVVHRSAPPARWRGSGEPRFVATPRIA
jgi:hypothetical protein